MKRLRSLCPLALLVLLSFARAALAERVVVIAGEHPGFTRVVLQLAEPSAWRFGRTDGGYGLALQRPDIDLDLSRAFRVIPRTRLLALEPAANGPGLLFRTDCLCHAKVVEDRPGLLVIDLKDGPPPRTSLFEAWLDRPAPPSLQAAAEPDGTRQLSPEQIAQLKYFWGDIEERTAAPSAIDITRDYAPQATDSVPGNDPPPQPIDITRDYSAPQEPAPALSVASPSPIVITKDYSAAPAPALDAVQAQPPSGPTNAPAVPPPTRITRDLAAPEPAGQPADPAIAPESALAAPAMLPTVLDPALTMSQRPADPTFTLRSESPRVKAAQDALLLQLSRAASQGLVDVVQPEKPILPSEIVSQTSSPPPDRNPMPPPLKEPSSPDDHMTIKAETSIDRDSLLRPNPRSTTPDGVACLPDSKFDVAAWGDDRPLSEQMTERRQALVGEFDAPSSEAVANLAKLYLFFGFGAEAKETLRAFGVPVRDSDLLLIMAESVDFGSASTSGRLKGMADCDTAAALWSVLAEPRLSSGDPVNVAAIVRTFSALPLGLRRLIGPVLSERFLTMGNEGAARTLRDAVTRAAGDPGAETRLVNARLDLTLDKTREAEAVMETIVAEDGSAAPKALILLIDTLIKQGVTVDQKTVETAAALAFEHRGTPLGSQLARAEVLSKAASDDFDAAFATLKRQTSAGPRAMPTELDVDLFTLLQTRADDATFLRHMFGSTARLTEADLPRAVRQALAQRLVSLGFPDQARPVLAAAARPKIPDRLILARIALAQNDPGAALRQVEGIDGPEAVQIKAQAMNALGYHAQAAEALERADQTEGVASAGWRAGDLAAVQKYGTPEQQAAINALLSKDAAAEPERAEADPAAPDSVQPSGGLPRPAAEPPGPLARNRALLQESQKMRDDLAALLNAFPGPAPAP